MPTIMRSVVMFLVGIVLFIGLPLLGWGVADLLGFTSNPVRVSYAGLVVLLQILVVTRFPQVGRNQGAGKKLVQRQQVAVLLLQVISLAFVIAAPFTDRHNLAVFGEADRLRYVGLILFAIGFVGASWSESTLGKQFSVQVTIQEDHQLITNGPYRLVRHPRYLCLILFNLGLALVFRSGLALALVIALAGVLLWRIQDEEALMSREFGTEWAAYASQSWRLIPYLY